MGITLEPLPFGSSYSPKNIPIPGFKEYKTKLISKGGDYINRTRFRSIFALNGNGNDIPDHPDIPDILEKKEN